MLLVNCSRVEKLAPGGIRAPRRGLGHQTERFTAQSWSPAAFTEDEPTANPLKENPVETDPLKDPFEEICCKNLLKESVEQSVEELR
jgi:hypothetical protein